MAELSFEKILKKLQRANINLLRTIEMLACAKTELAAGDAKDLLVKRFEISYSLLINAMFAAAKELPKPEARATPITFAEAHRYWLDFNIGQAPAISYNSFKRARNLSSHTYNEDAYLEYVKPILATFVAELETVIIGAKKYVDHE